MKKIQLLSLLAAGTVLASSAAFAAFNGPSGAKKASVAEAKGMADDTAVVLQGNITQNLGGEKYVFTDGKDTVTVEIDDEDGRGLNVGPEDVVVSTGDGDNDWTTVEIDVDEIVLAK